MIPRKQIKAAYRKVCPDVNPSIVDMFTQLIQEAIQNQDGTLFANRKARKLKKVFKILTGFHMPLAIYKAHQTFDAWVYNHAVTQRLPISGQLVDRLNKNFHRRGIPDGYVSNTNGGFTPDNKVNQIYTEEIIIIVKRDGRVIDVLTNNKTMRAVVIEGPRQVVNLGNEFRRIA